MSNKFFKSAIDYIFQWYLRPARASNRTGLPTVLNLPITDNCNSRCVMCDVWKSKSENEISASDLARVLEDPLFSGIEHVGISGGEPTLRSDLIEVVSAVLDTLRNLKSLSITSHGFHVSRWKRMLPEIKRLCCETGVRFTLNLSLDGIEEIHDQVRQVPGGYERVLQTHQLAELEGVQVNFQTTVSRPNVYGIVNIVHTTSKMKPELDFRLATEIYRLDNAGSVQNVALNDGQKSFFADFLVSQSLLNRTPSPARRLFYRDLAKRLIKSTKRGAPCYYQREGVLLTSHGELFHCSISTESLGNAVEISAYSLYFSEENEKKREKLINTICPFCLHDQSGAWKPVDLFLEVWRNNRHVRRVSRLFFAVKKILFTVPILGRLLFARPVLINAASIKSALCIGMYGGEHVGDAAILGGVIQRLCKTYALSIVYVSSFRPDRTQRWVDALSLPVKVRVIAVDEVGSFLSKSDCLVLAGGPVMDLPELLLGHLSTVAMAISNNIPFMINGVGIGPLENKISKWLAHVLFSRASEISVRSVAASRHSAVKKYAPSVSEDPAFDYLSSVDPVGLSLEQRSEIDRVLYQQQSVRKVGVNLRPFWHKYIYSSRDIRELEEMFLRVFADALTALCEQSSEPVAFYFFSMNSDQYGFSDLEVAYRLKEILPKVFPFVIWETEPDVEEVLYFLQNMELVLAMRFHAAIFSLSQNIPTIGVDYAFGKTGKVGELFLERGLAGQVCGIESLNVNWLVERMSEILDGRKALP